LYLATLGKRGSEEEYIYLVNDATARVFVLGAVGYLLWVNSVSITMPDVSKFPLDFLVMHFVPYWYGIRLDTATELGIDLALKQDIFKSPAHILG